MNVILPWASALDSAIECPASAVLARVREKAGEAAERGTEGHSYLEDVPNIGILAALAKVPEEHKWWCSQIDVFKLFRKLQNVRTETIFAIDVVAGKAWLATDEDVVTDAIFRGICDLDAFDRSDGLPVVGDHKTGKPLNKPSKLNQLRFFALAIYLMTGEPFVKVRVNYIEPDGNVRIEEEVLGPEEHDETLANLRRLRTRILRVAEELASGHTPTVTAGDHCFFCKSYHVCPAKGDLLKKALYDVGELSEHLDFVERDVIAGAWLKVREIEGYLAKVKAVVDEATKRVVGKGIPTEEGVLKFVESSSKALVQSKLINLAKDKGIADEAIKACYKTNTFSFLKLVTSGQARTRA